MASRTLGLVTMDMGRPVRSELEETRTDVSGSGFLNEGQRLDIKVSTGEDEA